jgi:hypothetical protein
MFKTFLKIIIISFLWGIASSTYAATLLRPPSNLGLVGYWPMNEGTSTKAGDFSGNRHTLVLGSSPANPTWINGIRGKALQFDGSDDNLSTDVPMNLSAVNTITLSFWMYWNTFANDDDIAIESSTDFNNNDAAIAIIPNNSGPPSGFFQVSVHTSGGASYSSVNFTRPSAQAWHHYVITFDRNAGAQQVTAVYLDGVSQSLTQQDTNTTSTGGFGNFNWYFMARDLTTFNAAGRLDEMRLYSRTLSASEALSLYRTGFTKVNTPQNARFSDANLKGYWSFNGPDISFSTNRIFDRSGNGLNGDLVNISTSTTPKVGKVGQAFNFDRVDDYITMDTNSNFNLNTATSYTWAFWIKPTDFHDFNFIWAQEESSSKLLAIYAHTTADTTYGPVTDGVSVGWSSGASLSPGLAAHSSDNALSTSTWSYVTVTYDASLAQASRFKIYVNGTDVTATGDIFSSGSITSVTPIAGGTRLGKSQAFSDTGQGTVDEFRYYNRALSATEIKAQYDAGRDSKINASQNTKLKDTNLQGLWSFNGADMNANTALDRSGNGFDAGFNSTPIKVAGKVGQALQFDGIDDQLDINDNAIFDLNATAGKYSWAFWINPTNFHESGVVWEQSSSGTARFEIYAHSSSATDVGPVTNGVSTFWISSSGNALSYHTSNNVLATSTWSHVVVTYDGTLVSRKS